MLINECEICKFQKNIRFLSKVETARILGINPNSTKKEAKDAYLEKARIYHPEKKFSEKKSIINIIIETKKYRKFIFFVFSGNYDKSVGYSQTPK